MNEIIEIIGDIVGKNGIGAGIVIVLCTISFFIIKNVLDSNKAILKMFTDMNEKWQQVVSEHSAQSREFHSQVNEAHKYQREEHKEMINNLKDLSIQNKEITFSLGRINGFKHD